MTAASNLTGPSETAGLPGRRPDIRVLCAIGYRPGYDAEIEAFGRRQHLQVGKVQRKALEAIFSKLGWMPLHAAVDRGDEEAVAALLHNQAPVNVVTRYGRTSLHLAADAGHAQLAKLLLDAGAALNPKDWQGLTPVQIAVRADHEAVVNSWSATAVTR